MRDSLHRLVTDVLGWLRSSHRFAFVRGHDYLSEAEVDQVRAVLDAEDGSEVVRDYEVRMAALIGPGQGVSFAAGRMAFYAGLKALGVGSGDEVVLLGFTCAVMPNAVWRTGAKPVFADVDPETLGSCPRGIAARITSRTRAVVAQHSFGIPCKIAEIQDLCRKRGLALIEDCAITLDSASEGTKVGNWGDAAMFSTDHSKPLNTLVGGFFYAQDPALLAKVRTMGEAAPPLNRAHQARLFQQFLRERHAYQPENHRRRLGRTYLEALARKFRGAGQPPVFLEGDGDRPLTHPGGAPYPYPAKMPPFLARLGCMELARWGRESQSRKEVLQEYLGLTRGGGWGHYLPKAYDDQDLDIVPLRFVFTHPEADRFTRRMARCVEVSWTWFPRPIICTDSMEALGYVPGSCPEAERIGAAIINWPCVVAEAWRPQLLADFQKILGANA